MQRPSTITSKKLSQINMLMDFDVEYNRRWTCHFRKICSWLWIMDYSTLARSNGLKLKQLNDEFVSYKSSQLRM